MRAELRYLHSPDAPDLSAYQPETPDHFHILIQAMIGPEGEPGEESFDFVVCTPAWLAGQIAADGPRFGRYHLLMREFDLSLLERTIQHLCSRTTGPDWNSVAEILARWGKWEFEDYAAW
jgi:hypothetical protein